MNLTKLYEQVEIFNTISGSLAKVDKASLALQLDLQQEEFIETVDAYDSKNPVELLDGVIDQAVVLFGMMQKLNALGVDVEGAFEKVNANNLSKFSDSILKQPKNTTATLNYRWSVYVFKDSVTGKVKKPIDFVPVDLSDITTGELLGVLSQDLGD